LMAAQQRWIAAVDAGLTGIRYAPPAEHLAEYQWLVSVALAAQLPQQEIRILRAELAESFQPDVAVILASVLSTSTDAANRNGAEALDLARRALKTQPDSPMFLNCLGAALAETGQYTDAIAAVSKALAGAQAQQDAPTVQISEALLASFKAGKPWRE
jgi:Tfp pilus assembly protein PilF